MKNHIVGLAVLLSASVYAQRSDYPITQVSNDQYEAYVHIDQKGALIANGTATITGVMEFNDIYEVKMPDSAGRIREAFKISVDTENSSSAISFGDDIIVMAETLSSRLSEREPHEPARYIIKKSESEDLGNKAEDPLMTPQSYELQEVRNDGSPVKTKKSIEIKITSASGVVLSKLSIQIN